MSTICGQKVDYRQQVSILWPSAYKAITISLSDSLESKVATDDVVDALPLSYTGISCLLGLVGWFVGFAVALVGFELATLSLLLVRNCIWQLSHGARSLRTAWNTRCEMGIIRCKHNGRFWMTPLIQNDDDDDDASRTVWRVAYLWSCKIFRGVFSRCETSIRSICHLSSVVFGLRFYRRQTRWHDGGWVVCRFHPLWALLWTTCPWAAWMRWMATTLVYIYISNWKKGVDLKHSLPALS